ncbi:hypothetical protein AAMO2058_001123600 [Amorphochlora amoebiformis]
MGESPSESGADLPFGEQWKQIGWQFLSGIVIYVSFFVLAITLKLYLARVQHRRIVQLTTEIQQLTSPMRSDIYRVFNTLLNIFYCGLFVSRSYNMIFPAWQRALESLGNLNFAILFLAEYSGSHARGLYMLETTTASNIFALGSSFYTVSADYYLGFGFLRALNALQDLKSVKFKNRLVNRILLELVLLGISVIAYIFVFSGLIYIVEFLGNPPGIRYDSANWTVYNSFYFLIVTLSTVGYGDFFATTFLGRFFMMFCILIGIILFATKTGELVAIFRADLLGHGRFGNPDFAPFVVVVGQVHEKSLELMLRELLHPDRISKMGATPRVVAIVPTEQKFSALRTYFTSNSDIGTKLSSRLSLYVGDPFENETLERLRVGKADAIYVLAPQADTAAEAESSDLRQLYIAVSLRRYTIQLLTKKRRLRGHPKIVPIKVTISQKYNWLLYKHPLLSGPRAMVDVTCYDRLIMSLLASSCFAPGFLTLLINMVSNIGEHEIYNDADPIWLQTYLKGAANEIFVFDPFNHFFKMDFWEAWDRMEEAGVLLMGYVRKNGVVYLSPSLEEERVIPSDSRLIALAQKREDLEDAGLLDGYDRVKIIIKQEISIRKRFRILSGHDNSHTIGYHSASPRSSITIDNGRLYESELIPIDHSLTRENDKPISIQFPRALIDSSLLEDKSVLHFECHGIKGDGKLKLLSTLHVPAMQFIDHLHGCRAATEKQDPDTPNRILKLKSMLGMEGKEPNSPYDDGKEEEELETACEVTYRFTHGAGEGPSALRSIFDNRAANLIISSPKFDARDHREDIQFLDPTVPIIREGSFNRRQRTVHRANELARKLESKEAETTLRSALVVTNLTTGKRFPFDHPNAFQGVTAHIVIFDPKPENLRYLLLPIERRKKVTHDLRPVKILIVHRLKLSSVYTKLANALDIAEDVFWIRERIRSTVFLTQICLHKARRVLVCQHKVAELLEGKFDYALPKDAPAMFLTLRLRDFLRRSHNEGNARHVPVVTEIESEETLSFLKFWSDSRKFTHPFLAEGSVVAKSFAQLLLMKSQDSPYLVSVISALMLTSAREGHAQVYGVRFDLMKKHKQFRKKETTFKDIREHFRKSHIIPLAVYCTRRDKEGKVRRYSVANPDSSARVRKQDIIIVLSEKVPSELIHEEKYDDIEAKAYKNRAPKAHDNKEDIKGEGKATSNARSSISLGDGAIVASTSARNSVVTLGGVAMGEGQNGPPIDMKKSVEPLLKV